MRFPALLVFVTLACAAPSARAAASAPVRAALLDASVMWTVAAQLAADGVAVPAALPSVQSPPLRGPESVPQRHAWLLDEGGRSYWYSVGASGAAGLGSLLLLSIPSALVAGLGVTGLAATGLAIAPFLAGAAGLFVLVHSVICGVLATVVWNNTNPAYVGDVVPAVAGHIAGAVLAVGVNGLIFGTGGVLLSGLTQLALFTGSAGITGIQIFSILGAIPGVLVGGAALVVLPAVIGVWALAATAKPKADFAIDPQWRDPSPAAPAAEPSAPEASLREGLTAGGLRLAPTAFPLAAFALPGI